jgi:ubiquinone/menaquinone biosynthesis C-methylase UbiE
MKEINNQSLASILIEGLKVGGAPVMWLRVLIDVLPAMQLHVPSESKVLELGYGDGLLSCYLCRKLGWQMMGVDIDPNAQACASENARKYGLDSSVEFHCCTPDEIWKHKGQYDAVFIKTVLYGSKTLEEYGQWLDWILSVLKPGGVLINFETGRANWMTQVYRRLRKRSYTDLCLYTKAVASLYDKRFKIMNRRYYGGWSQFLAPFPWIYRVSYLIEEALHIRDADNCFIMSVIARKEH